MRDLGQRLDVADIAGRVADAFAKDRARIAVDQRLDIGRVVGFGEADMEAEARQQMRKQRVSGAVELWHCDDVGAGVGQVEERVVQSRLPRGDTERADSALQRGDAAVEHIDRRVVDPAVAKTWSFEVEQRGAVLGAFELVGGGLVDRHGDRLRRRIAVITAMDGQRFASHLTEPFNLVGHRRLHRHPPLSMVNFASLR
jgi:hypothetical protein